MQGLRTGSLLRGGPRFNAQTRWSPLPALCVGLLIVAAGLVGGQALTRLVEPIATDVMPQAMRSTGSIVVFLLGMQSTVIALVLIAARIGGGGMARTLALPQTPVGIADYAVALAGCLALIVIYNAIVYAAGLSDLFADLKPFVLLLRSPWWLGAVLAVVVGAPIAEELLFRGFLLPALSRARSGFPVAALVTTLAWTGLHAGYSPAGMIEVMLVGLYFSWLLWRTGNLRVPLTCHVAVNAAVVAILMLAPLPL